MNFLLVITSNLIMICLCVTEQPVTQGSHTVMRDFMTKFIS